MYLQKTLEKLVKQFKGKRRNQRPKAEMGRQLMLEQLEERTLLSILFVPQKGAETANYGGGYVMANASPVQPIYTIFWGSYWNTTAGQTYAAQLEGALNPMFNSSAYLDGLKEYLTSQRAGVPSSGTVEVFDTFSEPSTGFPQSAFQAIVQDAIDNLGLPETDTFTNEGIYVVFTPPGIYSAKGPLITGYHSYDNDTDFFDSDTIHEAWVSTNGTLDGTTPTLSHELVETITDPNGDAWQVDPVNPINWNELCDNEAGNYTYRLNGDLVQSYWSQANGDYEVSDGNTQNFWVNKGQLTVKGDQLGPGWNDSIILDQNSSGGVLVNLNGEVASFDPGVIKSIVVNTGTGFDTVDIGNTLSGVPVTINADGNDEILVNGTASGGNVKINEGSSSDTVDISPSSQSLQNIQGNVTINGGSGTDRLNVDDQNDSFSDTWIVTGKSMTRTGSTLILYQGQNVVKINGGTGNNLYNITNTQSFSITTLHTGPGADTVNIQATGSSSTLNVIGDGNTDAVNLGQDGSVQGILGTVYLDNSSNVNSVTADDSEDSMLRQSAVILRSFGANGTSGTWGQISNLAPADIYYKYAHTSSLTVDGGTVATSYLVQATALASSGTTTLNTGSGNDIIKVGNSSNALDDITTTLTVNGQGGADIMKVNDGGSFGANTYTVTANSVNRLGTAKINYSHLTSLVLTGSSAGSSYTINSTAAATNTTVNGGAGNDTFNITASLAGALVIQGGGGNATLVGPNITNTWTISSAGGGNVDGKVSFTGISNLVGGTGNDTYKFTGATPSISGTITDTAGTNKLDYSAYTGGPISVNLATNAISLVKGGAAGGFLGTFASVAGNSNPGNTLTAANNPINDWNITATNGGKVNTFNFTNMPNLVGGTGVDVFKFANSLLDTVASINGGGGGDWLDYSGWTSAVNLVTGSATNVTGSISNIQNVHGGNTTTILTGDSQGNILIGGSAGGGAVTGGTGRSLLIADNGGAIVTGGSSAGDILVADYTTFDSDTNAHILALMSILAEWQSADTLATRFHDINTGTGGGLNGTNMLKSGTTVNDDASPDAALTVTAATATPVNWFFVDTNDIAVNFVNADHTDNT